MQLKVKLKCVASKQNIFGSLRQTKWMVDFVQRFSDRQKFQPKIIFAASTLSGQFYKAATSVNYDSTVVITSK